MSSASNNKKQKAAPDDPASPEERVKAVGKVESKTPGRVRMRLKPELRTPEATAKIQKSLEDHPDVRDVTINQRTGSVVVTHNQQKDGHNPAPAEALEEAELLAEAAFEFPHPRGGGRRPLRQTGPAAGRPGLYHGRVGLSQDRTALSWAASPADWPALVSPRWRSTASHWRCCRGRS